jgi:hypothetical protein
VRVQQADESDSESAEDPHGRLSTTEAKARADTRRSVQRGIQTSRGLTAAARFCASVLQAAFFLDSADLDRLPYETGGWGAGRLRLYERAALAAAAERKFGAAGFAAKRAAAAARRHKKRAREAAAASAAAAADAQLQSAPAAAAPDAALLATVRALRASLRAQVRKALKFTRSGAPDSWRLELPGTSAAVFAQLADKPHDPALRTFIKRGAFLDARVPTARLLGLADASSVTSAGYRGSGVLIAPTDEVLLKYKPATMLLAVLGAAEFTDMNAW